MDIFTRNPSNKLQHHYSTFYARIQWVSPSHSKVDYPLPEVLLLILLAVLAGAEAFTDIARFGERKIELLRRFRPYVNGTPSHDHLGDISPRSMPAPSSFALWPGSRR